MRLCYIAATCSYAMLFYRPGSNHTIFESYLNCLVIEIMPYSCCLSLVSFCCVILYTFFNPLLNCCVIEIMSYSCRLSLVSFCCVILYNTWQPSHIFEFSTWHLGDIMYFSVFTHASLVWMVWFDEY